MIIYKIDGTSCDIDKFPLNTKEFYVQDLGNEHLNRYLYPGDSLKYELDDELVSLYDKLRDTFFDDIDEYYKGLNNMPVFVQEAGQNSDCGLTADEFGKLIKDEKYQEITNFNKYLYLVDCQFLVGTIQNLLSGMEDAFVNYFIRISNVNTINSTRNLNETVYEMSQNIGGISAGLENYFIKAYSILDMLCKLSFEIQNPQEDFSKYRKMKSADLLWGARKNLVINGYEKTLFQKCDLVSMIESMRNEVVHNGTWELNPKAYIRFENGKPVERFMLFPDISQGRLAAVKSRKHFFGYGTKVNDILPKIHIEYKNRLLNTIRLLNNYPKIDCNS